MTIDLILSQIIQYYNTKLDTHGPSPRGVDWSSAKSQALRFKQLLTVCDTSNPFTLNDYGCGYGALVTYMINHNYRFHYNGFDLSGDMIEAAQQRYGDLKSCTFTSHRKCLKIADYTVASGIFNVKLQANNKAWQGHVLSTLDEIAELSNKGFAFNVLTKYSDQRLMRDDLFYADPFFLFDYCKINFSRFVAILHDYPLYEFTILVKNESWFDE